MQEYQEDFNGSEIIHPNPFIDSSNDSYIYALLSEKDEILYMGQSKQPFLRIAQHSKEKKFSKFKFFKCKPEKSCEIQLILYEKYKPKLNRFAPLDVNWISFDEYKKIHRQLSGKIKKIRDYISKNPTETRGGKYNIKYLDKLNEVVCYGK